MSKVKKTRELRNILGALHQTSAEWFDDAFPLDEQWTWTNKIEPFTAKNSLGCLPEHENEANERRESGGEKVCQNLRNFLVMVVDG